MFMLFNKKMTLMLYLCSLSMPAWADSSSNVVQNDICFFYAYMKGTNEYSDPANQVSDVIKKSWIELENDLARGGGDELDYLRGLASCAYVLPEKFWESQIKGLAYEERATRFKDTFFSSCFCKW